LFPRSHWVCFTLLASAACGSVRKVPEPTPDAALHNANGGGQGGAGGAALTSDGGGVTSDNGGTAGVAACANCSGGAALGGATGSAGATCTGAQCALPCGLHRFSYDPKGRKLDAVYLAGTFNNWRVDEFSTLDYSANTGVWSGVFDLGPGTFEYKFVLNGSDWQLDPTNPKAVNDGARQESQLSITCPAACIGNPSGFDWHDQVLYSLMIDRFADSDGQGSSPSDNGSAADPRFGYGGGDLQGVRQHLGYLEDLGVSAIWLSPPALNGPGGYHGYYPDPPNVAFDGSGAANPSPVVDPHFGTADDLHALVNDAHAESGEGMRVILDYVMKHVYESSGIAAAHPDFFVRPNGQVKLCNNGTADPSDDLWNDPYWGTRCAFDSWLWPFDFAGSPEALAWSINDAAWWARVFDFDGFRLDAINHVAPVWASTLRQRVSSEFGARAVPLYLVGETFDYDHAALRALVDPRRRLNGQLDFPLRAQIAQALLVESGPVDQLAYWIAGNDHFYGVESIMATFLGNHDLPRAIHYANGQISGATLGSSGDNDQPGQFPQPTDSAPYQRLALAFAVLLTSPGIPVIYYGDEIGLAGGGDPENRRMMPWDDSSLLPPQKALRDTVRELTGIRAKYKALSRGSRTTVYANPDTWLYRMSACSSWPSVLVAINRASTQRSLPLPAGTHRDVVSGATVSTTLPVPARSFRILEANVSAQ
jgi:glycosidase